MMSLWKKYHIIKEDIKSPARSKGLLSTMFQAISNTVLPNSSSDISDVFSGKTTPMTAAIQDDELPLDMSLTDHNTGGSAETRIIAKRLEGTAEEKGYNKPMTNAKFDIEYWTRDCN